MAAAVLLVGLHADHSDLSLPPMGPITTHSPILPVCITVFLSEARLLDLGSILLFQAPF